MANGASAARADNSKFNTYHMRPELSNREEVLVGYTLALCKNDFTNHLDKFKAEVNTRFDKQDEHNRATDNNFIQLREAMKASDKVAKERYENIRAMNRQEHESTREMFTKQNESTREMFTKESESTRAMFKSQMDMQYRLLLVIGSGILVSGATAAIAAAVKFFFG